MRVVAVTPRYPPESRVGAWLATHEFLAALARRGHDVEVRTEVGAVTSLDGVRIEPVGETAARWVRGADVVVSHAGDQIQRADQYAQANGIPSVVMIHGDVKQIHRKPAADLVVFNAESNQNKRWKGIVCRPHTRMAAHRGSRGDRVTLLNCSTEKGWDTFAALVAAMPDTQFLGVKGGYGGQHRMSGPNVTVNSVARDPREVWRRTRILVMPSIAETWGMAGVEAMCSGIPVIAHPTPGLQESLGDAGVFVDRDDIDGWRREIERLDDHGEYMAASRAAFRRAQQLTDRSTLDRFCDEIEARFA